MAHALTLRNDFLRENSQVLSLSVLAHLALFVLLALNLKIFPQRPAQPVRLAIQATVIDAKALRQSAAVAERRSREQALELQRREQERFQASERRLADQRRAAEQQRQAEQDARRREQVKREKAAAEAKVARAEQQRQQLEQQQAATEAARKAEGRRRAAQTQADLSRQLAEEEELSAAAESGELDQYLEVIRQKVRRNWTQPASARPGDSCDVKVQQIPGGEIVSAVAVNCHGDAAFARSVEVAVLRSSPLPPPPNPALFERNLLFNFKPEK